MNAEQLREVVHGLRRAAAEQPATADAELVRRYTAGDEAAFELLVWRHAALVLGVCRRVLHHAHDAEDAFQATWLTLARRARSVGRRGSVAGWLYQVAYRIALRAKTRAARRARHEQPMAGEMTDPTAADPAAAAGCHELHEVLDEQVGRLPERFRTVFVLRCLAGLTGPEAARELGCPIGTVESRLARARQRLQAALVRRGFTVPAVLVATQTPLDALAAPAHVVAATVRGMMPLITTQAVSPQAAALAEGVLRSMFMTKTRNITAVVAIGLTLAGVGLGWYGAHADAQGGVPTGQARDSAAHQLGKQVPTRELESEWLMEKAEVGGKISPDIGWLKNGLRWLIRGDNITIQRFGQSTIGTISVDLKKSPREIDIHLVEGPVPDERVYRGIYKREDMRLTVCYAAAGEPRPTAFATKAGSSAMLAVFRWTEGRTHGPVPSGRDVIYPPAQYVPQKKSSGGSKRQLGDMTPYVAPLPEVQLLNPYLPPAVMPGGPIQVAPVQLRVNPYTVPLQVNPYTVPLQINPYTAPPPVFKPLQLPPFELPKDAPPPRKRPDGSKDA